jgi:hypothetical protein
MPKGGAHVKDTFTDVSLNFLHALGEAKHILDEAASTKCISPERLSILGKYVI